MRQITKQMVAQAVEGVIVQLACVMTPDVRGALNRARALEDAPAACYALDVLQENARIAQADMVPLCQDTGYVWVCLEIGSEVCVAGDVMAEVDEAVARAYRSGGLRLSLVRDAFSDRRNTGGNVPAITEVKVNHEAGCAEMARLHVMLKGGGSDNASRVVMLDPGVGRRGIVDAVVACVREKGANACPPLTIGVGIGGAFDKVAGLAKMALMRPVGQPSADPRAADLEQELLAAVNATGVGPAGLGGTQTALAVQVETAACHIAALPLAINMGCCALRRVTIDLNREPAAGFAGPDTEDGSCAGPADGNCVGTVGDGCLNAPDLRCSIGLNQGFKTGSSCLVPAGFLGKSAQVVAFGNEPCAPLKALQLPLTPEDVSGLQPGDCCALTGPLYTLRDAGHARLLWEMAQLGYLPYGLAGQTIFYAGPSPARAGRPFGAIGPTTSSRMDFAAPALYDAGVVATVGKGTRSPEVAKAVARNHGVHFIAVGGAAAYLAECVTKASVVAYEDLGTEALRRIEVCNFPVIVSLV